MKERFSMKALIEETLNLFPEVTWDRWTGELNTESGIAVYGWIDRDDGRSDFLFLRIDNDGPWMFATSSAKYSDEFGRRLNFKGSTGHHPCKRVEEFFQNVKATTSSTQKGQSFPNMNPQKILVDDIAAEIATFVDSDHSDLLAPDIRAILKKHLFPTPEIQNCVPVILYFPDHAEADAFMAMVKEVKPNMEERKL